jgi:hypothetical protein
MCVGPHSERDDDARTFAARRQGGDPSDRREAVWKLPVEADGMTRGTNTILSSAFAGSPSGARCIGGRARPCEEDRVHSKCSILKEVMEAGQTRSLVQALHFTWIAHEAVAPGFARLEGVL